MVSCRTAVVLVAFGLLCLSGCANPDAVHKNAEASAQANIAVVGQQPSAELAAACERHVVQNQAPEATRHKWTRSTPFQTSLPWITVVCRAD